MTEDQQAVPSEAFRALEEKVADLEENQRKLLHWIMVLATQDWVAFTVTHGSKTGEDSEFDARPLVDGMLASSRDHLVEMLKREGIDIEESKNVQL